MSLFDKIANVGEFFTGADTDQLFPQERKGASVDERLRDISERLPTTFPIIFPDPVLPDKSYPYEISAMLAQLHDDIATYSVSWDDLSYISVLGAISLALAAAKRETWHLSLRYIRLARSDKVFNRYTYACHLSGLY
jgi:hypothetical protein